MTYTRPASETNLSKDQKVSMLTAYYNHYRDLASSSPESLNVKLPREVAENFLHQIGSILIEASKAANTPGRLQEFLAANPLPPSLQDLLPDDFRAFCLLLNALKQWVAAEQAATDRYLLGGTARETCRQVAKTCVVTGESLEGADLELHHPIRDGRPPFPISKHRHALLETQGSSGDSDPIRALLLPIKRQGNHSWSQLKRACQEFTGHQVHWSTPGVANTAKSFARKALKETGMKAEQLLDWLDEKGLGATE
jgi:hypothetical protein